MPEPSNIFRERFNFGKISSSVPIPNLLEIQMGSYKSFLQMELLPHEREDIGIQAVFKSIFPIEDFRGSASLEFVSYTLGNWECKCGALVGIDHLRSTCRDCGESIVTDPQHLGHIICPHCGARNENRYSRCASCGDPVELKIKYTIDECIDRGMTYAVPLKVTVRLIIYDVDEETQAKTIRDVKEQEVFFGEIPLMTPRGTFIINGTERVIVTQLHRSPGVFFETEPEKHYFLGKIIPYRGSWVEFEFDAKNILYIRIDRKRKFLATIFLRALGRESDAEILKLFYKPIPIQFKGGKIIRLLDETLVGSKLRQTITHPDDPADVIYKSGERVNHGHLEDLKSVGYKNLYLTAEDLQGSILLEDSIDNETGEILGEANEEVTAEMVNRMIQAGIKTLDICYPEFDESGPVISNTLRKDPIQTTEEALIEFYKKLRPGDPPTLEVASNMFQGMFFDSKRYDLSRVGRLKANLKLERDVPLDQRSLMEQDFIDVLAYLLKLPVAIGTADDIDHLGNRRVRAVGELMENQFRIGLVRMERAIKEKMSVYQELTTIMPHDLINSKPVMAALKEFFGSSQLSQFMDQTNPLSEITHKRRLSALGPGGLSRERAGFEVRDVHTSHYGRLCPIETPEGPNIGLISSLSCFALINPYGFIESPYRRVEEGRVVDYVRITDKGDSSFKISEIAEQGKVDRENVKLAKAKKKQAHYDVHPFYMTAWEEEKYTIAQSSVQLDEHNRIMDEHIDARKGGNFILAARSDINFIDVSPKQLVSVAASLIPFLEHDDANRALMGSNMQRQSVPLLVTEAPIVGTGMEGIAARDSGAVVACSRTGIVDRVDAQRIIIRVTDPEDSTRLAKEAGVDIYLLNKFKRSNQNTCINQKPLVKVGDIVQKGQVIADGHCTHEGELALGRNVLVAFMPWGGYNFEDAILISEKLVKEDVYTSIHIEELEIEARETKLGSEEITRDIPNVSEKALKDLDESGVIRIGAYVKPGSILVGKVTPKSETQLSPEEKLLRAIFGDKASDVKDNSLKCPPGIEGIVVDVKMFTRKGVNKDLRAAAIEQDAVEKMHSDLEEQMRILNEERDKQVMHLLVGKALAKAYKNKSLDINLDKGAVLTEDLLRGVPFGELKGLKVEGDAAEMSQEIRLIEEKITNKISVLRQIYEEKKDALEKGDELPPGVNKLVKVYVAMKRKISVGDKMAGRHGNKGVIAKILPDEDMPYLPDGTPVEIVLNPLGVPSRMNVGQILETHLGWAGKLLGLAFTTPVFDGAKENEIRDLLTRAGLDPTGKTALYDGKTGDAFEQKVTVGYIYMMKLSHLVDDKIHARSIGPYSLITQQPLGGKAQFGGQRFGEMEVWALEAYGAANILQELLTVKSDDVQGRNKIYESIVKNKASYVPGIPESFNVLVRELQSLCLDVELIKFSEN